MAMWSSAGDDLADDVADGERAGEADDGPLADEARRRLHRLFHGFARLIDHLLRVVGVEVVDEARGAPSVRALRLDCHVGIPPWHGRASAAPLVKGKLGTRLAHG